MSNRGACYGIAAQVQCKLTNKRDVELEREILAWISAILGKQLPAGDIGDILHDGVILCHLINALRPGSVPKINASGSHFKLMENIDNFVRAAKQYGVPDIDVFQTVDLWERRNIPQVAHCIMALGRACYFHPEFRGPYLGPKPSEEHKRDFSEAQLRASEGIINLQYGTNKCATQSGQNFGNTRHM